MDIFHVYLEEQLGTLTLWHFGAVVICLDTLLAWVREISAFRFVFAFANALLLAVIVLIVRYACDEVATKGIAEGVVALNTTNGAFMNFIGFSIYTYEGIGIMMPCMQACACPEKFDKIMIAAVGSLTFLYACFGTLCYMAYGPN